MALSVPEVLSSNFPRKKLTFPHGLSSQPDHLTHTCIPYSILKNLEVRSSLSKKREHIPLFQHPRIGGDPHG